MGKKALSFCVGFVLLYSTTASARILNQLYGASRTEVKAMQVCLEAMGYNPGPVDGLWGGRTNSAILAWSIDRQLTSATEVEIGRRFEQDCNAAVKRQQNVRRPQQQQPPASENKIRYGMAKGEMRNILGAPHDVYGEEPNVYWMYYINDNEIYLFQFQHGLFVDTILTTHAEITRVIEERSKNMMLRR